MTARIMPLLGCLCFASPVLAEQYLVTEIGVWNGIALSNNGVAAGNHSGKADMWLNGITIDLSNLTSSALEINRHDQIAGFDSIRAVIWEDGEVLIDLGVPDLGFVANRAIAATINDRGVIAGMVLDDPDFCPVLPFCPESPFEIVPPSYAFSYWNGEFTILGSQNGDDDVHAINNRGFIVGRSDGTAALFKGTSTTLLSPGTESVAYNINARGEIVGQSEGLPVIWKNGQEHVLPMLDLPNGVANALNRNSHIVGAMTSSPQVTSGVAVIWKNFSVLRLDELVVSDIDWSIPVARDINDKGQILVIAFKPGIPSGHTLILTPDCNDNFVADPDEIEQGLVADLNKNWIPDNCEPIDSYSISIKPDF